MTEEQKETIKLMKEWKDEVKQLVIDYGEGITKLEAARSEFKKPSFLEWLFRFAPYILAIILFLIGLIWLTYFACGGMIKIGDNQMTLPCKNVAIHKTQ